MHRKAYSWMNQDSQIEQSNGTESVLPYLASLY